MKLTMCAQRLQVLLSLGIASLLAVECAATSAATSVSHQPRHHVALSRLRSSRGRHLQAVRHRLSRRAPTPLTQAQEFVKADEEANSDFVRRCQVVVTVSDNKFLPVKPLDRFCQTTDAAMECRLKVGQRLKDTHARDGDMGKFCSAVYDWFQGKYGMKCPTQCNKLQCKSSCMWLDAKKKLNTENQVIKDDMSAAEQALEAIKALVQQEHAKIAEEKKGIFSLKMLNIKLGRAEKTLTEKAQDLSDATTKKNKVDTAAENLAKTITAAEESLVKREDSLMKQKFAIDKAKLEFEQMEAEVTRNSDRAKEDRAEAKSLEEEATKLGEGLADLKSQRDDLTSIMVEDQKTATTHRATLKTKVANLIKATKEIDEFRAQEFLQEDADTQAEPTVCSSEDATCTCEGDVYFGRKFAAGKPGSGAQNTWSQMKNAGFKKLAVAASTPCSISAFGEDPHPGYYKFCFCKAVTWKQRYQDAVHGNYKDDPRVDDVKELITNQYKRAVAVQRLLEAVEGKIRDSNDEIKQIAATSSRLNKQKNEATRLAGKASSKADTLENLAKQGTTRAELHQKNKVTVPTTTMKAAQAAQNKEKASKAKAEKTLKFMNTLQADQLKKVTTLQGEVENAKMGKTAQEDAIKAQEDANAALKKEKEALAKQVKDDKEALGKTEKTIQETIKAYKAAAKDLDKHKPEIVRLHSLQPEM